MFVRNLLAIVPVFVCGFLVPTMPAQTSVPQSYTLTVSSGMALEAMSLNSPVEAKVSRFGPREFVDVTAGAPAGPKAIHARHWFDLVTHKVYTLDVAHNTCSWMSFTAPDMPNMYDPVATPAPSAEELAAFNKNVVRRENVNGIAAKLSESSSDQGKSSVWAAENGNYPVKAVMTFPGAQPMLMLEAPPIAAVADYDLIQAVCDGVVLVLRPDHTNRKQCKAALELIPKDKLIGAVLNCVPNWFLGRYSSPYYYGDYGRYGKTP